MVSPCISSSPPLASPCAFTQLQMLGPAAANAATVAEGSNGVANDVRSAPALELELELVLGFQPRVSQRCRRRCRLHRPMI